MSQDSCEDEYEDTPPQPTSIETPRSGQCTQVGENNQRVAKSPFWKRLPFWNVVFNFILAITTALLFVIAYWQYQATNEAIKISETTLQLEAMQQRPWIGVINSCLALEREFFKKDGICAPSHPRLFQVARTGERITARVTVANVGQLPAMRTQLDVRWCIRSYHPRPTFEACTGEPGDAEKSNGPRPLLPNSAGGSAMEVTHSFPLGSQQDITAVNERRKSLFMIGRVTYSQGGDYKDFVTLFCLFYDPRYPSEKYAYYYCDGGQDAE